ncbi:13555_t:CDS:2, partial [Dentiscutata erythropus]
MEFYRKRVENFPLLFGFDGLFKNNVENFTTNQTLFYSLNQEVDLLRKDLSKLNDEVIIWVNRSEAGGQYRSVEASINRTYPPYSPKDERYNIAQTYISNWKFCVDKFKNCKSMCERLVDLLEDDVLKAHNSMNQVFDQLEKLHTPNNDFGLIEKTQTEDFLRNYSNTPVALKELDNSENIGEKFYNEIGAHIKSSSSTVLRCYGISKNSKTKNFVMVFTYAHGGDLRNYLMQSKGLVHHDLHPGNLLNFRRTISISDLGLCSPANIGVFGSQAGLYDVVLTWLNGFDKKNIPEQTKQFIDSNLKAEYNNLKPVTSSQLKNIIEKVSENFTPLDIEKE